MGGLEPARTKSCKSSVCVCVYAHRSACLRACGCKFLPFTVNIHGPITDKSYDVNEKNWQRRWTSEHSYRLAWGRKHPLDKHPNPHMQKKPSKLRLVSYPKLMLLQQLYVHINNVIYCSLWIYKLCYYHPDFEQQPPNFESQNTNKKLNQSWVLRQ